MRKISVGNPDLRSAYKTYLASAYSSGTALSVLSNVSFAPNDLAVFGEVGEELTELQTLTSLTGKTTLNAVAALNFAHPKDTPVYKAPWNFIEIETESSSAGPWSLITQSPIQWDKLNTTYYHQTGAATDLYRFRFYNSVTGKYSEYSPTVLGSGFTSSQVGYMIRNVRQITNDLDGRIAGDRSIIRFFNEAQNFIRGVKTDWSWLKVLDTSITTVASKNEYALPVGVGTRNNISDVRYHLNNSNATNVLYPLKYLPEKEFDMYDVDQNRTNNDYISHYTIKEADSNSAAGYLRVYPTPSAAISGTFYIRYYKDIPNLDTVEDATIVPMPQLLETFAISKIEQIRGNEATSQMYSNLFYGKEIAYRRIINIDAGITLLLKQDTIAPIGEPMNLFRYKGRHGLRRYYTNAYTSNDYIRENYF